MSQNWVTMWVVIHLHNCIGGSGGGGGGTRDNVCLSSCGRQKGPSMMTQYARSYSLQKGPSLEDSVE